MDWLGHFAFRTGFPFGYLIGAVGFLVLRIRFGMHSADRRTRPSRPEPASRPGGILLLRMAAARRMETSTPTVDQRVVVNGVTWAQYCLTRELFDSPGIRLAYLEGALEIMSPSPAHEFRKTQIARLLEVFSLERRVPLVGYGSTTFRREARERGAEPDECYCLGRELGEAPDIAIEVVMTSGGIDKLAIYAGLGVKEVWFWRADRFWIHVLDGEDYQEVDRSRPVPSLDLETLATFVRRSDQYESALAFRDLLRAQPST